MHDTTFVVAGVEIGTGHFVNEYPPGSYNFDDVAAFELDTRPGSSSLEYDTVIKSSDTQSRIVQKCRTVNFDGSRLSLVGEDATTFKNT